VSADTPDRAEREDAAIPRAVHHVIRLADVRDLTGAETFEALARAGLTRRRLPQALEAVRDPDGNPTHALAGMRFLQAAALELELRRRPVPAPTWEDAMGWHVEADLTDGDAPELEAERREYRVAASILTGLPPDAAEALPIADVEAFAKVRNGGG